MGRRRQFVGLGLVTNRVALLRLVGVSGEEVPQQLGGVDFPGGGTGPRFKKGMTAGPSVTTAFDGVENHIGILRAVCVRETANMWRDGRVGRTVLAAISFGGEGDPIGDIGESTRGDRGGSAMVKSEFVSGAVEKDKRHRP